MVGGTQGERGPMAQVACLWCGRKLPPEPHIDRVNDRLVYFDDMQCIVDHWHWLKDNPNQGVLNFEHEKGSASAS
jgi:hypothetical protein